MKKVQRAMRYVRRLMIAGLVVAVMFAIGCSADEPTPVPPTATSVPEPTATQVPTMAPEVQRTSSGVAPTATAIAAATSTAVAEATATAVAEATASAGEQATVVAEETATAASQAAEEVDDREFDARRGGVFRLLGSDPVTFDPALTTDSTSYDITLQLFSGLTRLTDDPNNPIVTDLAESFTVSADGTVYRFVLREGLVFSDGSPLTAFDFKWSWERAALPETGSPIVKEFLGDIVGINDIVDGNATSAEGITVIDDLTLEVKIDSPKPYFIAKLTYPVTFVVNRDNVESGGETWTEAPIGSGPFVLKSYEIGVSMILARNDNYWDTPAFLDEVHFILAGGSAMAMYENDEIHVTGIPAASYERVTDPNEEISQEVVDVPAEFVTYYIGFNVEQAPFDDVHFRRALNYAVDKELIAEAVLNNRAKPAYGPIPPGFVGFNPDLEGLRFDADKAKEELAMSKYADPESLPRIVFTTPGTGGSPPTYLLAVADMWARTLGVEVEFQEVEWATFLQEIDNYRLQVFSLAWSPDYPDPHTFVDVLFRSDSSINQTQYSNAEVDALLDEATTEPDPARRVQLYQQAEQIIVNDAVWVPMWWGTEGKILVNRRVNGFRISPLGSYYLKDVWIEKEIDF